MPKTGDPTNSTDEASGEGFLGRWSRRKKLQREGHALVDEAPQGAPAEELADVDADRVAAGNAPAEARGDDDDGEAAAEAPVLTDDDMPALETLGEDDDYSGFLSPGVSEALRTRALRQLFRSSQFNELDGLNDYADDFTSFEPLGDIVTSDMRHQIEMKAEQAAREAEEKARALLREEPATDAGDVSTDTLAQDQAEDALGQDQADAVDAHEQSEDTSTHSLKQLDAEAGTAHVPGQRFERIADTKLRARNSGVAPVAADADDDEVGDAPATDDSHSP